MSDPIHPALRLTGAFLFAAVAVGSGAPAFARHKQPPAPEGASHEVVQPLPPAGASGLDDALKQLAADPRDPTALLAAGNASLALNDVDAAVGFFTRAEAIQPAGGEAKAGLAAAQVHRNKPVDALKLFDEAAQAGAPRTLYAGDHGLAYDLVGDNARAQEFYRLALQQAPNDDITRRLALSQAIGGDQAASERTLLPLLQQRNLAAYRTRAFALAALGKADEAVSIADTMMPGSLAGRIAPYLRYMPKLTRAQQAAAANFGQFPAANQIGHDDPQIAAYTARAAPVTVAARTRDDRLVPTGAPLGSTAKRTARPARNKGDNSRLDEASKASAAAATQVASANPVSGELPPVSASSQQPALTTAATQANPPPARKAFDLSAQPEARTGAIDVNHVVDRGSAPETPAPVAQGPVPATQRPAPVAQAPAPQAARPAPAAEAPQPSIAQAFAEFEKVITPKGPAPGAVDMRTIKPTLAEAAKPEPPKPAKPAKPKNPSRIWVQVATGANRKALSHDWDRITRKAAKEFKGKDGYLVDWGRTNRLVTGPFANEDKAQDFVTELKKAGVSTFMFTSDDGEEVAPLPDK